MTINVLTPPAVEPVALAELRQFLRLQGENDDALVSGLLKAARETLEAQTGLALIRQSLRLYIDRWPTDGRIRIARYPVQSVICITAYQRDGTPINIPKSDIWIDAASRPACLHLSELGRESKLAGIEIDFVAGFGETGADVPDALKHALMTLVAHWYEFRGVYGPADHPVSLTPAFDRAVALWRRVPL
ncbi:hypothetical protein HB779_11120 [Phyllobacterium sp. 628]|uniref:head-tail connector protein n=1 Tax=Phyllobacterium sp. 628 TaxID=2718938 RepID=UPI0016626C1C|nr:phage head-tail connector protein [Phyllobacterium sp. 628]QND52396.1 hypothetical protein HB779_11120 [Phyllobacterium sp. 628]